MLTNQHCEQVSALLKSLSHPVRLKILCHLLAGECSVGHLTAVCRISQSAMSQFLGRMRNEGVLLARRQGSFVFYRIGDSKLLKLLKSLKRIYG